jgi:hypothetical protein
VGPGSSVDQRARPPEHARTRYVDFAAGQVDAPIDEFSGAARATLRWRYRMGAELGELELECRPATCAMPG